MEPRNISTQVNYSLRPHVYWLNTFGHLSKKKEEEEKNNSTEMPGLWFTSPNILITREDSKVKPSTRILIEGSQEKGSATSSQVNIIFHFFPRYFTNDFFLSLTQQRCVYVAADCKSIRWSMYKRVKYWMKYCWILVHWYRFWEFNLIFFRGLWWMGYQGLH